ncbi:hypothetical protein IKF12_00930 [Candidatus Saccharibacteria bacterium]|nr:hypothetical protein [Candidatus Saccharibacteria bacterium]
MKRSRVILSSIISIILGGVGIVSATSALEYQSNPVDIKFEFGSTLNITTGGNISISNLTPGTKAISASNYNVTVSTNNLTGYTLSATVGCSSGTDCYDSKNLSDGTNTFSMLSADGALTAGTWGVSLDSNATANSNFKTLAKYDETATIINQTTNNTGTAATGYSGTANTTVRVGAYATTSQVAGTYTNSINFIAVANAMPEFMQDMTSARLAELLPNDGDIVTLYDKRDGAAYTIGKLADDNYWMLDNLAIDLVSVPLSTLKGNTNATDTSLEYLKGVLTRDPNNDPDGYYATAGVVEWSSYTSYSAPLISSSGSCSNSSECANDPTTGLWNKNSVVTGFGLGSSKIGIYYNYCAATAGSYCYGNGESAGASLGNATSDVCPSGWRMPTGGWDKGEYYELGIAYGLSSDQEEDDGGNTGLKYNLSTPFSGLRGITHSSQGVEGYFWSSTRWGNDSSYLLHTTSTYSSTRTGVNRIAGFSIRCLFSD